MSGYSSAAIFASEAIATCFAIYIGESCIANEVLAATKGRAMGWGFVALGFGLAFGVGVLCLGYISAHMNPATCIALLILGKLNGIQFAAAVGGEFIGAWIGACFVWMHFLPHFKTIPAPPTSPDEMLLKSTDYLTQTALGIASYNAREEDIAARERGLGDVKNALADIHYYLKSTYQGHESPENHANLVRVALGPDEFRGSEDQLHYLRRRSVQVCDVHRRLKDIDINEFKSMLLHAEPNPTLLKTQSQPALAVETTADGAGTGREAPKSDTAHGSSRLDPAIEKEKEKLDRLYDAAIIADQNAKLSIFATRPAIYSPGVNFLCEFMSTVALIYGALMIYARRDLLYGPEQMLFNSFDGLIIGFFIFVLVLGLGGPTGIAANPARDFSPRVAHFILPIPNKGPSEFYYSWIPFLAPLCGGCAAAGLYAATQLMNHSQVPGNAVFSG